MVNSVCVIGCPAGVFSPGVPAVFLANYEAAVAFLEGLERRCTLRADVEAFRASAAVDGFLKRWKLSVYFSLRFQVVVSQRERVQPVSALKSCREA